MEHSKNYKQIAIDFLTHAAKGEAIVVFRKYVSQGFKHHNAYFKGDAETLMIAMEENAKKNPNKVFKILRTLQDGDLVAVHSHVQQSSADTGAAVIHIFRFEGDKIAELWDFGQAVPADMVNENGMF